MAKVPKIINHRWAKSIIRRSAERGEIGYFIGSGRTTSPTRLRMRRNHLSILQALDTMVPAWLSRRQWSPSSAQSTSGLAEWTADA